MANAKAKGSRGELEAVHLLQPVIDEVYKPHTDIIQPPKLRRSVSGGYDIAGLEWMALEVKNCKTLCLEDWWQQTCLQCINNKEPVLMYKMHGKHKGWRAMHMINGHRVIQLQDDWLDYFRKRVRTDLDAMIPLVTRAEWE